MMVPIPVYPDVESAHRGLVEAMHDAAKQAPTCGETRVRILQQRFAGHNAVEGRFGTSQTTWGWLATTFAGEILGHQMQVSTW